MIPAAMKSGLQRRLLLLSLVLFALVSIYFDYQTAGSVALQKDQQLLRLIPLMADSVLSSGTADSTAPGLLLAPEIEGFIKDRQRFAGFRISDSAGVFLAGESLIDSVLPATREPEFHSIEGNGVIYRIAAQRVETATGELIVQLANQLLSLSRADALSIAEQPMQQVDLKDLCESLLSLHLDAATHKGIDLGLLDVESAQAHGHGWLLRELLGNLVDNAVKYTPAGGSVTIRCGALPHETDASFLEVVDDGPGIAVDEGTKALERFYRVPGTKEEGNGLGLAIADEIARVHKAPLVLGDAKESAPEFLGLRVRLVLQLENPHPKI